MNNETEARLYLFFTGAPGSRWSAVSQKLGFLPNVNNSDLSPQRIFHHQTFSGHQGMYFGPGMELGKSFDNLAALSRNEIMAEIDRAYEDKNTEKLRIIKGHIFSYQLEILQNKFPESRIMLVWRENDICTKWWFEIGGFNIKYPKYDWYINEETIRKRIIEENQNIKNFVDSRGLKLELFDEKWIKQNFGVDVKIANSEYFEGVYVALAQNNQ